MLTMSATFDRLEAGLAQRVKRSILELRSQFITLLNSQKFLSTPDNIWTCRNSGSQPKRDRQSADVEAAYTVTKDPFRLDVPANSPNGDQQACLNPCSKGLSIHPMRKVRSNLYSIIE